MVEQWYEYADHVSDLSSNLIPIQACVGGSIPPLVSAPIAGYGKPEGTWLTGVFLTAIEHTGSSPVGAIKWRLQQSLKTENAIDNIFPFETASCKKKEVAYEPKRRL